MLSQESPSLPPSLSLSLSPLSLSLSLFLSLSLSLYPSLSFICLTLCLSFFSVSLSVSESHSLSLCLSIPLSPCFDASDCIASLPRCLSLSFNHTFTRVLSLSVCPSDYISRYTYTYVSLHLCLPPSSLAAPPLPPPSSIYLPILNRPHQPPYSIMMVAAEAGRGGIPTGSTSTRPRCAWSAFPTPGACMCIRRRRAVRHTSCHHGAQRYCEWAAVVGGRWDGEKGMAGRIRPVSSSISCTRART